MSLRTGILVCMAFLATHAGLAFAVDLPDCGLKSGKTALVTEVIDGDTVVLEEGSQVRLVGIQAPKLSLGRKGFRDWPLAEQAKKELEGLVLNQNVQLFFAKTRKDRHGRFLAHLVMENPEKESVWVQGEMLRRGFARVYSFKDNRICVREMLAIEALARASEEALWDLTYYRVRKDVEADNYINSFQLVEGRVENVAVRRDIIYLNFSDNWRTDFTIAISTKDAKRHFTEMRDFKDLTGKKVRVRGWLEKRNGPMITATHMEQFEILE